MNSFVVFVKLIRLPNLLMLVLAQYISIYFFHREIDYLVFILISISTVFIAAAGYIINDIEDVEIDEINNQKINIDYSISILLYTIFSIIGLFAGLYVSYLFSIYYFIYFVIPFLSLLLYSKYLSKYKIFGNILISLLVVESIYITTLFSKQQLSLDLNVLSLSTYMMFAFFMNWIREIIKDFEDIEGDKKFGRKTIPLMYGENTTKIVTISLLIFTSFTLLPDLFFSKNYFIFFLISVLNLFLLIKIFNAQNKQDFNKLSFLIKVIMFIGILYPIIKI